MKIAYLHGLESKAGGKKVEWLSKYAEVYAPALNYKNSSTFNQVYNDIKKFNPDVIIGSSMGGWFSYLIGSKLGIHTILFNPAVTGRSFDPAVDDSGLKGTFNTVIQGSNDTTIIPKDVKEWLGSKGKGNFTFDTYNGEHKVPFTVFKDKVSKILGIKEMKILSFTEFITEGYYKNLAPSTVGAGQEQWGYARVNSFLTQAPGTWGRPIGDPKKGAPKGSYGADADVAQEVIKGGHDKNLKK